MKYKDEWIIKEVPLINLIRQEDLERLNKRFNKHYKPEKLRSTRITEYITHDEINDDLARLMRTKPERGGYGV